MNNTDDYILRIDAICERDDDAHLLRIDALTTDDDDPLPYDDAANDDHIALLDAIDSLRNDRDAISAYRLSLSICPIHNIDYAACFDDDDDECAAIRDAFPSHDT